mmetsp:Transcript_27238/g.49859  ORF Transcript_27238/g.49859 Transcript_27238/m.49859 type:complete len:524 (-) Transcript_27238:63-1634(-)
MQRLDIVAHHGPERRGQVRRHTQRIDVAAHSLQRQRLQTASSQRKQIRFVKLGRRRAEMPNIKALDQLRHLSTQLDRVRRAQPRHQAEQSHRLHATFPQIAQGQSAKAFRQRLALRACQQRVVGKVGYRTTQRFDDLNLRGGVGYVIRPAHHMGHAHIRIVHNRRDGIQDLTVLADQNRVTDACRVNADIAQNAIVPLDPRLIQLEAPDTLPPLGAQRVPLGATQRQCGAIINGRFAHVQLFFAFEVQFGRRLERLIKPTNLAQLIRRLGIAIQPLRLPLNPVPMQAQPLQVLLDRIDIFFLRSLRISIVDTQDERAPRLAGNQVVHQGGAQVAHMDKAGGRRGETGGCHGSSPKLTEPWHRGGTLSSLRGGTNRPMGAQIHQTRLDQFRQDVCIHRIQPVQVEAGFSFAVRPEPCQYGAEIRIPRKDIDTQLGLARGKSCGQPRTRPARGIGVVIGPITHDIGRPNQGDEPGRRAKQRIQRTCLILASVRQNTRHPVSKFDLFNLRFLVHLRKIPKISIISP